VEEKTGHGIAMFHFLFLSLLLQPPAHPMSRHRPMPSLPVRQFTDDVRSKDIEDVLALYTPDAVFIDPAGKTFSSPADLRSMYMESFATYDADLTFTRKDFSLNGDGYTAGSTAVEMDDYQEQRRTRSTNTVETRCGGVASTWVRTSDGRWQISNQKWTEKSCPAISANK
jgi:ketosteroid isomerase-like protein